MNAKRLLMAVVAVLMVTALTACNGDKPKGLLKQGAMLYINVKTDGMKAMDETTNKPTEEKLYTPKEVVEQASLFMFTDPETGKIDGNISILDVQKDVENARIKMWGEQVISKDGELVDYFIKIRDLRIVARNKVIGYVSNATMERAEREIRKAYEAGDFDKVYRLFQDAYTAVPINDEMWDALKEKGEQ